MERHISLIGILWIVMGGLSLLFGFLGFLLLFGISFIPDMGREAPFILRTVGSIAIFFFALFGLPKIIAGIGLLKKKEWGRILTLIVSFISLLNIPLGTALGIYSIIILLKEESIPYFKSPVQKE
ncbi:hypothetical protein ACFLQZ_00100 [Acidobacteriota bacterium]